MRRFFSSLGNLSNFSSVKIIFLTALFTSLAPFLFSTLSSLEAHEFGSQGRDGFHGVLGRNGRSGPDSSVKADGQFVQLDLSGTPGERGGDGGPGEDAYACHQPYEPSHDVHGAPGGRGGAGGDGGNGGRGGDTTIRYAHLADLKNIFIRAEGAPGAPGGLGEAGGYGCPCRQSSWTIRRCHWYTRTDGSRHQRCSYDDYQCHPGKNGHNGRDGSHGSHGRLGKIFLIPGFHPLPEVRPSLSTNLGQLTNQVIPLSYHHWSSKPGANALLAPGSVVSDIYEQFERTIHRRFALVWASNRAMEAFAHEGVNLSISYDQISFRPLNSDFWIVGEESTQGDLTTFTIRDVVQREEAEKLKVRGIQGKGENLVIVIEDEGRVADRFETKFELVFKTRFMFYVTGFKGSVPPELIERRGNTYLIHAGKLGMDDKYTKKGRNIELTLKTRRKFASEFDSVSYDLGEHKLEIEK